MKERDLILYEMPWFAEWISWEPLQEVIAWCIAHRIVRKMDRYKLRTSRRINLEKL